MLKVVEIGHTLNRARNCILDLCKIFDKKNIFFQKNGVHVLIKLIMSRMISYFLNQR